MDRALGDGGTAARSPTDAERFTHATSRTAPSLKSRSILRRLPCALRGHANGRPEDRFKQHSKFSPDSCEAGLLESTFAPRSQRKSSSGGSTRTGGSGSMTNSPSYDRPCVHSAPA